MATLLDHLLAHPAAAGRYPLVTMAGRALRRLATGRQADLAMRAGVMALAGAGLLAGGLEIAAALLASHRSDDTLAAAVAPRAWSDIVHPLALYDLAGTDFVKLQRSYSARRQTPDGAREDVMSFGALGQGKPYLRIALLRRGATGAGPEAEPLADILARTAAGGGDTVTRLRALAPVETRFGRIERADLLLWDGGIATACVGFRGLPDGGRVLQIAGFGCGTPDRPIAGDALACAIDRIDLVSAGEDRPLRATFVTAARRAGSAACGGGMLASAAEPQTGPDPFATLRRHAAWLDAGAAAPSLRGPITTDDER